MIQTCLVCGRLYDGPYYTCGRRCAIARDRQIRATKKKMKGEMA